MAISLNQLPVSAGRKAALSVVGAWTVIEALSPEKYNTPKKLSDKAGGKGVVGLHELPWVRGEELAPGMYHHIVIGAINVKQASDEIAKIFGEDEEKKRSSGMAIFGAIIVDHRGYYVGVDGASISSFAWALDKILSDQVKSLTTWGESEMVCLGIIDAVFSKCTAAFKRPVTEVEVKEAFRQIKEMFDLPAGMIADKFFAITMDRTKVRDKSPPDSLAVNSFYLNDLAKVSRTILQANEGDALSRYMNISFPENPIDDVLYHPKKLKGILDPSQFPLGKWPTGGGRNLNYLQQAAVNSAFNDMSETGVMGVNGPPGTGKTTLLRDIVAGNLVERAKAMVSFERPWEAFSRKGKVWALSSKLKGFEMVVASSNNRAVENVSKELPQIEAMSRSDLDYFRFFSDALIKAPQVEDEYDEEARDRVREGSTWGLIAAVLGRSANRSAFREAFFWNEDTGIKQYLLVASGKPAKPVPVRDSKGVITGYRPSKAATIANPPNGPAETRKMWDVAKAEFIAAQEAFENALNNLVRNAAKDDSRISAIQKQIDKRRREVLDQSGLSRLVEAREHAKRALQEYNDATAELDKHQANKPSIIQEMEQPSVISEWNNRLDKLEAEMAETAQRSIDADADVEDLENSLGVGGSNAELEELDRRQAQLDMMRAKGSGAQSEGVVSLTDDFYAQGHEVVQTSSPWLNDDLHRLREDLFVKAMKVHKAFVCVNSNFYLTNLAAATEVLSVNSRLDMEDATEAWASLFTVVPVVSTTFASLGRMFASAAPGTIGWLLVDEAGQASPQQAVGGVRLAKRVLAVGDPLQVEPVVSLPQNLMDLICKKFRISEQWVAPIASVQSIVDGSSRVQATFGYGDSARRTGMPLLVHRRCQEPMFSVSNAIAYDGQMVNRAVDSSDNEIANVIGGSQWVDVVSEESEEKWSHLEGEVVTSMLRRMHKEGIEAPDLFIISPFRKVVHEMISLVSDMDDIGDFFGKLSPQEWARERIGTVHTFQGREADSVFIVLGAPLPGQAGARSWAGSAPNILNVAVTRAKKNVYVVGNKSLWSRAGYFETLSRTLVSNSKYANKIKFR